jgi:HPt (histidine-containing phosphotransfer) domain-containing protein
MHSAEQAVPVLDQSVLSELQTLGTDVVAEISDLFVRDVPNRLNALRQAIDERSRDVILREAHGLKGSALGVGAMRLAHLCAAIESDAREGRLDRAAAGSARLEEEFGEARRALREKRDQGQD